MSGKSTYLENAVLNMIFRNIAYVPPTTIYASLHTATTLNSAAAAMQTYIITNNNIPVGSSLSINPNQANNELRTVVSVTGTGPYTITLNAAILLAHVLGENVEFDPIDGAKWLEPTGSSYSRTACLTGTAGTGVGSAFSIPGASTGDQTVVSNTSIITFPSPLQIWGYATHIGFWDASTAGNLLYYGQLSTFLQINNGDAAPIIQAASWSVFEN